MHHILVIANRFPVTSETFVVDHVVGLAQHGWRVTVCAASVDNREAQSVCEKHNIKISLRPLNQAPEVLGGFRMMRAVVIARHLGLRHVGLLSSPFARGAALRSLALMDVVRKVPCHARIAVFGAGYLPVVTTHIFLVRSHRTK